VRSPGKLQDKTPEFPASLFSSFFHFVYLTHTDTLRHTNTNKAASSVQNNPFISESTKRFRFDIAMDEALVDFTRKLKRTISIKPFIKL
jgi:hypothetical protein